MRLCKATNMWCSDMDAEDREFAPCDPQDICSPENCEYCEDVR